MEELKVIKLGGKDLPPYTLNEKVPPTDATKA
jgi:hypothetical protein